MYVLDPVHTCTVLTVLYVYFLKLTVMRKRMVEHECRVGCAWSAYLPVYCYGFAVFYLNAFVCCIIVKH